ncbi:nuclear transport factor 2 family protein [Curtobacterium sp. MCPF17_021]|uniref:nuclear transport factor 2 family protein n=1 Tax=Curtobacterium sp. MCPF17_021 TaxID=2175639 RepID=UPI000DA7428B|nr:nuclear transport factor 2 family protein [Curtobacterium sp. MCPF17_021]WIE82683.1 nuclear transport factor 2 family protein [Curtobacterium sp. MCPF17_021]WIE85097.1 nuclear transport factor 2 family protein [Curtobacterium sp. MCPF17_021]
MSSTPSDIISRIFAAIDDHRFDDLVSMYASDVEATTVMGVTVGADLVVEQVRAVHEPIAATQHLVSGVVADIAGNQAEVRGNVTAIFCDEAHTPAFEGSNVWRGRLIRHGDIWLVTSFSINLVWARGTFPQLQA